LTPPSILVAGIGNIFLGDDAFGSAVARGLLKRAWPENVQVVDFGIRGFDLAFALLDRYDAVILIDAAPRGSAPGSLYVIEPDLNALDPNDAAVEMHGMNPMRVMAVARSMGAQLGRVYLVGCEPSPETLDPNGSGVLGLSDAVLGSLDKAVKIVEDLVTQIVAGSSSSIAEGTKGVGHG
jgi:hydrogenase maturation protease